MFATFRTCILLPCAEGRVKGGESWGLECGASRTGTDPRPCTRPPVRGTGLNCRPLPRHPRLRRAQAAPPRLAWLVNKSSTPFAQPTQDELGFPGHHTHPHPLSFPSPSPPPCAARAGTACYPAPPPTAPPAQNRAGCSAACTRGGGGWVGAVLCRPVCWKASRGRHGCPDSSAALEWVASTSKPPTCSMQSHARNGLASCMEAGTAVR